MTAYATTAPETTVDWRRRAPLLLVWAAAIGYVLVASYFSLRKHDAFLSGYDLATFDQELWLLAHGHEPLNTADGRLFWGEHFQLTIALLAPLYLLGAGATTLLALQSVTMAAVAPLLYVLGRVRGATPWLAALPALLWLASPATLVANLADVHAIPLVAPVIVGSIIALERDRLVLFAALAVLACCAKEDVSLIYVMVGLVVVLEGRRRLGATIGVAALGIFVFATAVFMPAFGDSAAWYEKRFAGARGDSLTDVAGWMLRHPADAATDLITGQNIAVVLVLLLSTGGLCLLATAVDAARSPGARAQPAVGVSAAARARDAVLRAGRAVTRDRRSRRRPPAADDCQGAAPCPRRLCADRVHRVALRCA